MPRVVRSGALKSRLVLAATVASVSQRTGVFAFNAWPKAAFMGAPPLLHVPQLRVGSFPRGPKTHRGISSSPVVCSASASGSLAGSAAEPVARQEPVKSEYHGFVREDPFHWMKDDNWQQARAQASALMPGALDFPNFHWSI
jgi:hypothetical protein